MRPRSSSRGRNINAPVTVTVTAGVSVTAFIRCHYCYEVRRSVLFLFNLLVLFYCYSLQATLLCRAGYTVGSAMLSIVAIVIFSLLQQVIKRLAREGDGHLVKATLCLLEVSKSGLLETELLDLLGDEDNLVRKCRTKDGLSK